MKRMTRSRGFTLVEVLATMVLMGILLPTLMQAVTLERRVSGQARRKIEAAMLADSKLNELVAVGQTQTGALAGDFSILGPEFRDYRWSAQSTQFQGELPDLWQMTVRVSWTERMQERSVDVTTLVYTGVGNTPTTSSTGSSGSSGGSSAPGGNTGSPTGGGRR